MNLQNKDKLDIGVFVSTMALILLIIFILSYYLEPQEVPEPIDVSKLILTINNDGLINTGYFSQEDIRILNLNETENGLNKLHVPRQTNLLSLSSSAPIIYL